ncbi:hypothetical protein J0667_12410 [Methylomonas sp. WH-1]|uniref:hypothetical protein n=1 Tax=unclassified Methylomonas TaxID=2608980 RepID=UPI00101FE145|nr:hypothetical protein [Methylomonas sp. LW13]
MSLDSIISLFLGIPIGLVSGLYTGLIVTRYSRFSDLRNEVLRIIRAIEYMPGTGDLGNVNVSHTEGLRTFNNIAGDLYFLKHEDSGDCVLNLLNNINSASDSVQKGRIDNVEFGRQHALWQKSARELTPSKKVLWALWGNI